MERGISAVIKHFSKAGFSGSLRFAVSEINGVRNIDLCEDSETEVSGYINNMDKLKDVCNKLKFGWILVYLKDGDAIGFNYKINYQGCSYKKFERECIEECSVVRVVARKSST